jgi:hypothetical protein
MTVSRRHRLMAIGSWLILALVLLPSITFMGHWGSVSPSHHSAAVSDSSHELHCHGGVSSCAGSEAMVGTTWIGEPAQSIVMNAPVQEIEREYAAAALDGETMRIDQPPRSGIAA